MEGEDEFAHLRDVYQKNNDVKEKLLQEKKSTSTGLEEAKPKFVEHLRQFVEVYGKKEESR